MVVRVSFDDGETYSQGKMIYDGFAAYSGVVLMKSGKIGVIYENGTFRHGEEDSSTQYEKITFDTVAFDEIV